MTGLQTTSTCNIPTERELNDCKEKEPKGGTRELQGETFVEWE